jgi:hypothetical protein
MRAKWNWLRLGVGFTLKRPWAEGPNWEIPRMPQYSQLIEVTHRGTSPHVWKMCGLIDCQARTLLCPYKHRGLTSAGVLFVDMLNAALPNSRPTGRGRVCIRARRQVIKTEQSQDSETGNLPEEGG